MGLRIIKEEKLFPISANPDLCILCERCSYSCSSKAIFFKNSMRFVNYNKCEGCLKCVSVCEHGAIEVISLEEGALKGFEIDDQKCTLCKTCLSPDFCFQNLYELKEDKESNQEYIIFNQGSIEKCQSCLKCFKECPNNAIIPLIE